MMSHGSPNIIPVSEFERRRVMTFLIEPSKNEAENAWLQSFGQFRESIGHSPCRRRSGLARIPDGATEEGLGCTVA
jgi:hypothetical protein